MSSSKDVKIHTTYRVESTVDTVYAGGPICEFPTRAPVKTERESAVGDGGPENDDAPAEQQCHGSSRRVLFAAACGGEARIICLSTGAPLAVARVDDEAVTSIAAAVLGSDDGGASAKRARTSGDKLIGSPDDGDGGPSTLLFVSSRSTRAAIYGVSSGASRTRPFPVMLPCKTCSGLCVSVQQQASGGESVTGKETGGADKIAKGGGDRKDAMGCCQVCGLPRTCGPNCPDCGQRHWNALVASGGVDTSDTAGVTGAGGGGPDAFDDDEGPNPAPVYPALVPLRTFRPHGSLPVTCSAFDPSGRYLATGSSDGTAKVFDAAGGFATHSFPGHGGVVTCVRFCPVGGTLCLAAGAATGALRIWGLREAASGSGALLAELAGHVSAVADVQWSRDGGRVYSAGRDSVLNVWGTSSVIDGGGSKRKGSNAAGNSGVTKDATIPVYETLESIAVTRGSGGRDAIVCCGDGEVASVWCPDTGRKIATTPVEEKCKAGYAAAIALTDDDGTPAILLATRDHHLNVRNAASLLDSNTKGAKKAGAAKGKGEKGDAEEDAAARLPLAKLVVGFHDEVTGAAFVLGDSALAVSTNSDVVHVLDHRTGHTVPLHGHGDVVLGLDASRCGRYLATCGKDSTAIVWDLSGCMDRNTDGNGNPNGQNAAPRPGAVLRGHAGAVAAVALSRKRQGPKDATSPLSGQPPAFAVTGSSDRTIKVWDVPRDLGHGSLVASARATVFAHDKDINAVAVSPNDRVVASGSQDKTAKLWNAVDLAPIATLRGHKRGVWSLSFSPSDAVLATCSADKTIRLWSLRDNSCVKTLDTGSSPPLCAPFLSTGAQIATTHADGSLKLWTLSTDSQTRVSDDLQDTTSGTLMLHSSAAYALSVSKDSLMMCTGGTDGLIRVLTDATTEVARERELQRERHANLEQGLRNAIRGKNWARAMAVAIEMGGGRAVREVVEACCATPQGDAVLDSVLAGCGTERAGKLVEFCRDWNTNARFAHAAHAVLGSLFRTLPPRDWPQVPGIRTALEALTPYSKRHYERVSRMARETYLIDHLLDVARIVRGGGGKE